MVEIIDIDFTVNLEQLEPVHPPRGEALSPQLRARQGARFRAEARFFDPKRSKRSANELQGAVDRLAAFHSSSTPEPVCLDGLSARWIVTVERMYAERMYVRLKSGVPRNKVTTVYVEMTKGLKETFKLGSTTIVCKKGSIPKEGGQRRTYCLRLRFGQVEMTDDPESYLSYNNIFNSLCTMLNMRLAAEAGEQSKNVANILIDLAHGEVIGEEALREKYCFENTAGKTEAALRLFHRLFFLCLVRETGGWQSAAYVEHADEYKAGLTVSFARALLLLRDGHLKLKDVFKTDCRFNPYTVTKMFEKWEDVLEICKRIDERYQRHNPTFKLDKAEQAHKDLRAVFGGDSDTDGDEYSDSDEEDENSDSDEEDENSDSDEEDE